MDLINSRIVENIITRNNLVVTDDVKKLIVAAINSIDQRKLTEAVSEEIMRDLRRMGLKF